MKRVTITEVGEDTEAPGYYVRFRVPDNDAEATIPGVAFLSRTYVWTHISGGVPEKSQIADHVETFISEHFYAVSAQLVNDPCVFFVNTPNIDRQSVRARLLPCN